MKIEITLTDAEIKRLKDSEGFMSSYIDDEYKPIFIVIGERVLEEMRQMEEDGKYGLGTS